jgi:Tfp pilus assembly protein FimV
MKNGKMHYGGIIQQLWVLVMAAVFMADANALVLGDDIQVDSALGRPLNARVAILDLTDGDAQQFKVRLADRQDYKNLGLIYPDNHKFRFQLVSEPGKPSYIQVTSLRPVVDPFVDLLIETTSAAGKLVKSYTVLLDPASSLPTESNEEVRQAPVEVVQPVVVKSNAPMEAPAKAVTPHRKHHHKAMTSPPDDHRQMKLSMSLSIAKYDPSMPASTNSDALQEELIAKEKLLDDLKVQIGEMQLVIKDLREKQEGKTAANMGAAASAVSAVPAAVSAVMAASAVSPVPVSSVVAASHAIAGNETNKPKAAPVLQPLEGWRKPVVTLASLLTVVSCLFWFRRRMQGSKPGTFDDLHGNEIGMASATESDVMHEQEPDAPLSLKQPVPLKSDRTEKSAADNEQKGLSIVPPEYTVLMEANKHLRAGNDDLAEAALLKAIGINPNNAYGYLALLKLYEKRSDKSGFEKTAKQLQLSGDVAAFNEAAAMGKNLDPDNPLYAG